MFYLVNTVVFCLFVSLFFLVFFGGGLILFFLCFCFVFAFLLLLLLLGFVFFCLILEKIGLLVHFRRLFFSSIDITRTEE